MGFGGSRSGFWFRLHYLIARKTWVIHLSSLTCFSGYKMQIIHLPHPPHEVESRIK